MEMMHDVMEFYSWSIYIYIYINSVTPNMFNPYRI